MFLVWYIMHSWKFCLRCKLTLPNGRGALYVKLTSHINIVKRMWNVSKSIFMWIYVTVVTFTWSESFCGKTARHWLLIGHLSNYYVFIFMYLSKCYLIYVVHKMEDTSPHELPPTCSAPGLFCRTYENILYEVRKPEHNWTIFQLYSFKETHS